MVAVICSCAPTQFPLDPESTYIDADGKASCAIHQEALAEVDGYWTGDPVPLITPTDAYIEFAGQFPNHIGLAQSLEKTEFTPIGHPIRYCRSCEAAINEAIDR